MRCLNFTLRNPGYCCNFATKQLIVPTMPALVPFAVKEEWCHQLQGLSLKNVQVSVVVDGKQIYSDFGELLFTHYGVSGPLILSASSHYVHKACGNSNCSEI